MDLTANPQSAQPHPLLTTTRRQFFKDCGLGLGSMALASMLTTNARGSLRVTPPSTPAFTGPEYLRPRSPHFPPKAKNVIFLFMNGAPSQIDLFDNKPRLQTDNGKECPEEFFKGERFAFIKGVPKMLGSPYSFARHGKCGAEISELLPHIATIADDLTIVRSMKTDAFNHAPAELFMNTGLARVGRPSIGSWLTYGLGSECSDLPGFVVLLSGGGQPSGGCSCWSSGFLPSVYQGVQFRSAGEPVLFVNDPPGVSSETRRRSLDAIADLNRERLGIVGDPEIATRIESFEMAYRMQSSVPELSSHAGSSNEACASSSSTTAAGTATAAACRTTSFPRSKNAARKPTKLARPSSRTSSNVGCSTTLSSFGAASSGGPP